MNFKKTLEQGHSKEIKTAIVNEIGNSPKKMDELMKCFIDGPFRITQRAAWPMSYVAQNTPNYYLNTILT